MKSSAATVAQYLQESPPDRRAALDAVRATILANLDGDYEEGIHYGMISYHVPHRVFPAGYHCKPSDPLPYVALASQKNHLALYLMPVYGSPELKAWFEAAWKGAGKKLDLGKSCLRFKKLEDVALNVIGELIRRTPAQEYIAQYQATLAGSGSPRASDKPKAAPGKKQAAAKSAKKAGKPKAAGPKSAGSPRKPPGKKSR